jgi:post-segregation antitoxin (ccd killing protein)
MGAKRQILLYIDSEIAKKAKELGLNLSKVSENALKEAVRRLEGMNSETGSQDGIHCDVKGASWCGGWDSNPRRPSPEDLKSSPLS